MSKFNPLDYPVALSYPHRLPQSAWAAHVPFAMFMVEAMRPRLVVELGAFSGTSYCAFCQAVKELDLATRCYAVDTWLGDAQSGFYDGAEILKDLRQHHDSRYGTFSNLIQSTFDEAVFRFDDGTIDLLHLDGFHTYEAVRHDFETWLPKMSERGVMLLHDTNVREGDFGVWRLWEELKAHYPAFEFVHEHGLGVLAVGAELPPAIRKLLEASDEEQSVIREFFAELGHRLRVRLDKEHELKYLAWQFQDKDQESKIVSAQQETIDALLAELDAKERRLNAILNTRSWRWANRLGAIKMRYFEPPFEKFARPLLRRLARRKSVSRNGAAHQSEIAPVVDKACRLGELKKSVRLLPQPDERQLNRLFEQTASAPPAADKPDVICFSIIDWDFRYQRPQQVMSQFAAQGHRVFYLKLGEVLPRHAAPRFAVKEIKNNVFEITLAAFRPLSINQEVMRGVSADALLDSLDDLRRACRIDAAIAYVMTPSWKNLSTASKERWGWHVIYDCMDEWEDFPGFSRLVARSESELARECDLLVVTAATLEEKWRRSGRLGPTALVRNGVDFDYYQSRCQPNLLLEKGARPLVGFFGAIAEWLDLDLLAYVAQERPQYDFVLLGGVFDVDVSRLEAMPNVKLLGQQPYETMPLYLFHFDACLIPFKLNHITHATDPVKFYEYLSAGKPIVSTALNELRPFAEYLYIAQNREEFLAAIDRAIIEDDERLRAHRREFARQNSWQARYENIIASLAAAVPSASIVIVTYNNLTLNKLCLESVLRNTGHLNYEVIVVDNNSTDGTPEFLREFAARHQNVRLIQNDENHGFAKANNQGLSIATGEHLVLLNNDTVVPPGWLYRLLRHLDDASIGMIGPATNFVGNEAKVKVDYQTWAEMEEFAARRALDYDGENADIKMLAMFCVAMRRETFESVGSLDEQFGIGMFEDDDYTERVKMENLRVVCAADAFVHHFGQAAFKKLIERGEYEKIFEENRRRFETKWKTRWIPHRSDIPLRSRSAAAFSEVSLSLAAPPSGLGSPVSSPPPQEDAFRLPEQSEELPALNAGVGYFGNIICADTDAVIDGWMLAPSGRGLNRFALYLDGQLSAIAEAKRVYDAAIGRMGLSGEAYSFHFDLPASKKKLSAFSHVSVIGCTATEANARLSTLYRSDLQTKVPTPPENLMFRVTGNRNGLAVKTAGLRCATEFLDALGRHRELSSLRRVLDWGCGCGRVTLHLADYLSRYQGAEVYGCDIDAEAIEWCRRNLHPDRFSTIKPLPPTGWANDTFDAVFSCSVFTHLTESIQIAWLKEMKRVLAPGGIFLASISSKFFPHQKPRPTGISDEVLDPMLDGIAPRGYYRGTSQTRDYTINAWSPYLEILNYIENGLESSQDLVVMRKPI